MQIGPQLVDLMFRAFSDRTRLRLLYLLRGGELCVCDLVAVIGAPQPKISRHLGYLRRAGLVTARRDGLWSHYALAPAGGEFHSKLLECLGCCFTDVPELAEDARLLAGTKSTGRCTAAARPQPLTVNRPRIRRGPKRIKEPE